jgi:hypothetical protein
MISNYYLLFLYMIVWCVFVMWNRIWQRYRIYIVSHRCFQNHQFLAYHSKAACCRLPYKYNDEILCKEEDQCSLQGIAYYLIYACSKICRDKFWAKHIYATNFWLQKDNRFQTKSLIFEDIAKLSRKCNKASHIISIDWRP